MRMLACAHCVGNPLRVWQRFVTRPSRHKPPTAHATSHKSTHVQPRAHKQDACRLPLHQPHANTLPPTHTRTHSLSHARALPLEVVGDEVRRDGDHTHTHTHTHTHAGRGRDAGGDGVTITHARARRARTRRWWRRRGASRRTLCPRWTTSSTPTVPLLYYIILYYIISHYIVYNAYEWTRSSTPTVLPYISCRIA